MRTSKVKAIYLKEIRELIRDKKTMFITFGLPLILFPLLLILISTIVSGNILSYESKEYRVAFDSSITDIRFEEFITENVVDEEDESATFVARECSDYETGIRDGEIDAYVTFDDATNTYTLNFNSSVTNSDHAYDHLIDRMDEFQDLLIQEEFDRAGLKAEEFLEPIKIEEQNLASNEQHMGTLLGMIVPLLLIMGVFMGTMSPAMDLTAGEKERGTQETLMTFPVTGTEIVTGKYLAVATFGILSTLFYIITIGVFAGYMAVSLELEADINISAFIPSLIMVIISTVAFSFLLGAAIMCICSLAKSTKEASSYISPMMLVITFISYAGYLDVHLSLQLSIVPVLNLVLLCKSVMNFEYDMVAILVVMASNVAYAAIAITILGKLYTSEKILFGEAAGGLFDRDTERKKGSTPTWTDGILILAITMVLYLYLGSLMQIKLGIIGVGLTQVILVAVPLIAVWYGKTDYQKTFSLAKIKVLQIIALVLMAIGAYFAVNLLIVPLQNVFTESSNQFSNGMSQLLSERSNFVTWFIIAVTPAIGEEALFRGYMFSSLSKKLKPMWVILITALVFGIYHLNLYQSIYAFILGIVLGYVVYKTGSIFASSLIHCICNSISVILNLYPDQIQKILPFMYAEEVSNLTFVAIILCGIILFIVGLYLLIKSSKKA